MMVARHSLRMLFLSISEMMDREEGEGEGEAWEREEMYVWER